MARPRKEIEIPNGFRQAQPVKVSNPTDFKGFKLGLILGTCKDGGITVWLTSMSTPGTRVETCIHTERGHTIEGIEIDTGASSKESRSTSY